MLAFLVAGCLSGTPFNGETPSDSNNDRRSFLTATLVEENEIPEEATPLNLSETPEDRPPIIDKVIEQAVNSSSKYNTSTEFIPQGEVSEVEDFLQNYERYENNTYIAPYFTYKEKTVEVIILRQQ